MRVLIAGLGYSNLRDLSLGPAIAAALARQAWPAGVEVDDLSYGPIAVMHRLREAAPYDRLVLVAAVQRDNEPGAVTCYRWDGALPGPDEVQSRVAEAVTGVISLDNLLIVAGYFGALPDDVIVVEVEPQDTGWGDGLSPRVQALVDEVIGVVRRAALAPAHEGVHGRAALGGRMGANGH